MWPGDRRRAGRRAASAALWNGLLVARVGMQPIIATLILMVAGRGIAQLITGGQIITIYYAPFFFLGSGYLLGPAVLGVHRGGGVRRCCTWLMTRTALGLFIQAVGINPAAARVAGVQARRDHRLRLRVLRLVRRRRRADRSAPT